MVRVGIVGASGYTSSELLRFLIGHPGELRVEMVTSETYPGQRVDRIMPNLRGLIDLEFEPLEIETLKDRVDVVVLAVPHKVAMSYVPEILKQGLRVIDFSADYRLDDPGNVSGMVSCRALRPRVDGACRLRIAGTLSERDSHSRTRGESRVLSDKRHSPHAAAACQRFG